MAILQKTKQLKKELNLFNVYTIATGATIASGFFLLPGIAFAKAGPAVVLSYFIAVIPLIPAVCSMAELSTAMPRAGGIYYFLDRSMGPLWGTLGGLGTWFTLILKSAFALIGIGAYLNLFLPKIPIVPVALGFAVIFGSINLLGAKKTGIFQALLVAGLLLLLFWFTGSSLSFVNLGSFSDFFNRGLSSILGTAGMVFISYIGMTKIASISEEIKNPEKNIPLGMFMALGTALFFYTVGTFIMVGALPEAELSNNLTPPAAVAEKTIGTWGPIIVSIAAVLAFFSVANAGILSSSRYPLGMSRDHLLPSFFKQLTKHKIPRNSILVTVLLILVALVLFDPVKIAKLAGAFQLLLFSISCFAVIIMRESRIQSYDPGFRSPLYPWMQIFGILSTLWLIISMGWISIIFSLSIIAASTAWYYYYARRRVIRDGAIYHIFARLGERRFEGLDRELRGIMKEKGLRDQDPFERIIVSAKIIDLNEETTFEDVVDQAADSFSKNLKINADILKEGFLQGTRLGATPVSHGVALPHLRFHDVVDPVLTIVRSRLGVSIEIDSDVFGERIPSQPVHALFFLVGPEDNPAQHLRLLAYIAEHVDYVDFIDQWLSARNERELKDILLRDDRFLSLALSLDSRTSALIGCKVSGLNLPKGCLISLIHRGEETIIPDGQEELRDGDHLTIIGYPDGIKQLYLKYKDERV